MISPHPEAHPELPHSNKGHSYLPGNSKSCRSSVLAAPIPQEITKVLGTLGQEPGPKLNITTKGFPSTPIYKGFRSCVSGTRGRDQHIHSNYFTGTTSQGSTVCRQASRRWPVPRPCTGRFCFNSQATRGSSYRYPETEKAVWTRSLAGAETSEVTMPGSKRSDFALLPVHLLPGPPTFS